MQGACAIVAASYMVTRIPQQRSQTCQLQISKGSGAHLAALAGRCKNMKTQTLTTVQAWPLTMLRTVLVSPVLQWLALLGLCAAYLQGGIVKAVNFSEAIAEMHHFGLAPAAPLALATITLEIGASLLVLSGYKRWLGALALSLFTLIATFVANRFWEMAMPERFMAMNSFFEHLGLVGGFLFVAWYDLNRNSTN
jgi:uncharacterized membrane protein YphA (DoxX/SURF4 family)